MPKKTEMREGEEAAERFRKFTEKVMSVPKAEIDKRAAKERAKKDGENRQEAEE